MNDMQLNEYLDLNSIIEKFPQFSKNQWRWVVANKDRYQISNAIKRIGRKLYFHVPSLVVWIDRQNA